MSTHRAILRYRAGATDITVYTQEHEGHNNVSYVGVRLRSMTHPIRLTINEARELRTVLNWCLDKAGEGER